MVSKHSILFVKFNLSLGGVNVNIKLMEKAYKEDKFVLYLNGFVGVVSNHTLLDDAYEVLKSIGYNVTDVNYISFLNDDVPNNEADYWHEGGKKTHIHLSESKWTHQCKNKCCFDKGYRLTVNEVEFTTDYSVSIELFHLLKKLGHSVTLGKGGQSLLSKPGFTKGDCLEYLNDPLERQYVEYKNRNLNNAV